MYIFLIRHTKLKIKALNLQYKLHPFKIIKWEILDIVNIRQTNI